MPPEPTAAADRDQALDQVRREYERRTERYHNFDPNRRRADQRIVERTLAAYESLLRQAGLFPLGARSLLDVGCGRMEFLVKCREDFGQAGATLAGADLMADRIEQGQRDFPYLELRCTSADQLPWPDGAFDIVHQSMLLTSVLDDVLRRRIAADMARVTRSGGYLLWYDFVWNPVNRRARGIGLRELRELFPGWQLLARRRVTLAPPLSRVLTRIWDPLVDWVEACRVFNLWELALLRKP